MERDLGINIQNEGVSGDTTRDALTRLDRDVLQRDPSVVIVWLGGNDILQRYYERLEKKAANQNVLDCVEAALLRISGKLPDSTGISEDETFANLRTIVERIHDEGAVVLVVGFSGGVFDRDLEDRYQTVAEQTGALYVPSALANVMGRPSRMSDLVHPNNAGYSIVADRIGARLQCVLPE